jgi:hypothetical protein
MDKLYYVKLGGPDRAVRMDESTERQNETDQKTGYNKLCGLYGSSCHNHVSPPSTVIPRLTKIIRSGITFVSRNLR